MSRRSLVFLYICFCFLLFFYLSMANAESIRRSVSLAIKFNDGACVLTIRFAMCWVVCFVYCLGGEYQLNSSSRICVRLLLFFCRSCELFFK